MYSLVSCIAPCTYIHAYQFLICINKIDGPHVHAGILDGTTSVSLLTPSRAEDGRLPARKLILLLGGFFIVARERFLVESNNYETVRDVDEPDVTYVCSFVHFTFSFFSRCRVA